MYKIGVDFGGTKMETALLDPEGRLLERRRVPAPIPGYYAGALDLVGREVARVQAMVPAGGKSTLGMGIPGSVDARTGLVRNANSTYLIGRPFKADLEKALGRKIGMENDANCFALAEARQGAGQGYGLVFGVIMGTGCGGGLVVNGGLRPGPNRIAGEWGHASVDPAGRECYCGNRGCVETLISGSGVETDFADRHGERLSMREITAKARLGEPRCREALDRFLLDFGRCLGGLVSILDPDVVVLGGGLSNIDELYTTGLAHMKRFVFHESVYTPVMRNRLGDSAGVIGAAWIGTSP